MKSLCLLPLIRRDGDIRKTMHMCMALPLLPADNIQSGLVAVQEHVNALQMTAAQANSFDVLFSYVETQWIQSKQTYNF